MATEWDLEKVVAQAKEIARAINKFADDLERIEKKYANLNGQQESAVHYDPIDKLDKLELSTRTYNYLKRANFNTIGDIINKDMESADDEWIFKVRHIENKSVEEIYTKLADKYHYTLKYWRKKDNKVCDDHRYDLNRVYPHARPVLADSEEWANIPCRDDIPDFYRK